MANPAYVAYPPAVVAVMKDGWSEHIPLSCLTDAACQSPDKVAHSVRGKNSVHTMLVSAQELWLSTLDFIQASARLVALVRAHYPDRAEADALADTYACHFNLVVKHPNFSSLPGVLVEYDVKIRRQMHDDMDVDLTVFQEPTYSALYQAFLLGYTTGKRTADGYPVVPGPPKAAQQPFRNNGGAAPAVPAAVAAPAASVSPPSSLKCLGCGNLGHNAQACAAPLYLVPDAAGRRVLPNGGGLACYGFNLRGCSRAQCTWVHVCSLCGDPGHNAQRCPAGGRA